MLALIQVRCRAEHSSPGRPLAVWLDGQEQPVEALLHSWREPGLLCFLLALEGAIAEIAYDQHADHWLLRQWRPLPPDLAAPVE